MIIKRLIFFVCLISFSKSTWCQKLNLEFKQIANKCFVQVTDNVFGKYILKTKQLKCDVLELSFFYKKSSTFLNDSSFVCYYNADTRQFEGMYVNYDSVTTSHKPALDLKIIDSVSIRLSLSSDTYKSKNLFNCVFIRNDTAESKLPTSGEIFSINPGTRYYYRLKTSFKRNTQFKGLYFYTGPNKCSPRILVTKKELMLCEEFATNGNDIFYQRHLSSKKLFILMGFGNVDERDGPPIYKRKLWLTIKEFNQYFERF